MRLLRVIIQGIAGYGFDMGREAGDNGGRGATCGAEGDRLDFYARVVPEVCGKKLAKKRRTAFNKQRCDAVVGIEAVEYRAEWFAVSDVYPRGVVIREAMCVEKDSRGVATFEKAYSQRGFVCKEGTCSDCNGVVVGTHPVDHHRRQVV